MDREAAHDGYPCLDGGTGVRARVRDVGSRVRLPRRAKAGRGASLADSSCRADRIPRRCANSCSSTRRTCRCSSWARCPSSATTSTSRRRRRSCRSARADGRTTRPGIRCRSSTPCGATTATCGRLPTATGRSTRRPTYCVNPLDPTDLTCPPAARTSIFDPTKQVAACDSGNADATGSRNQNIYTARIAGGLFVGSPGSAKPLSATLQRGFVVFAQNMTTSTRNFRMRILNQPPGGRASFAQFPLPPYTSASPAPADVPRRHDAAKIDRHADRLRHVQRPARADQRRGRRNGRDRPRAGRVDRHDDHQRRHREPAHRERGHRERRHREPGTHQRRHRERGDSKTRTSRTPTSRTPISRTPTSRTPTSRTPTSRTRTSRTPTSRTPTSRTRR